MLLRYISFVGHVSFIMAATSFISPLIIIAFVFFLRSYLLEVPKFYTETSKYWSDKFLVSETRSFTLGFKVSLPGADTWHIRRRFSNARVPYSINNPASFNPSLRSIILSGDVHPLPGPEMTRNNARKSTKLSKKNFKEVAIAHLNVRSLRSRENFYLVSDTITVNSFDIFTISETWLETSTSDADIQVPGYALYRLDRGMQKAGGGLCIYIKDCYKASVVALSISDYNFQQLRLKVQLKTCKSFLLGTVYRHPNTPISFLENLTETFMDLSLLSPGLDMILLGDLNRNLLGNCPDGQALIDFIQPLTCFNSSKNLFELPKALRHQLMSF